MKRILSASASLVIFTTLIISPQPSFAQESMTPLEKLYRLELPEDIGTIEQRWEGAGEKMLILVQDSHISLEVQLNIAKIIQLLVDDYDLELVNIEGADHEKIDFQELRELEPRDVVEKVSIDFLKESRINGAVYAKINSEKDFVQYGTEDKDLYLENYKFYLEVIENNAELIEEVSSIRNTMMKQKQRFISKRLIEFINLEILFRDGDTSLLLYFKRILKNANKLNIDLLNNYPMVYQLIELAKAKDQEQKFKTVDSKRLLDELADLSWEIKQKLAVDQEAKDFVNLLDKLMRLEEFLRLRVLQTDFELYTGSEEDYRYTRLSEAVNKIFPDWDTAPLIGVDDILLDAEKFYKIAHDRSTVMFDNSLENMEKEGKDFSVVVSGGYHTEAVVELCRANDIAYLRVMPNVTTDEVTVDYEGRMLSLKSELLSGSSEAN